MAFVHQVGYRVQDSKVPSRHYQLGYLLDLNGLKSLLSFLFFVVVVVVGFDLWHLCTTLLFFFFERKPKEKKKWGEREGHTNLDFFMDFFIIIRAQDQKISIEHGEKTLAESLKIDFFFSPQREKGSKISVTVTGIYFYRYKKNTSK
jgi:hypothetical protein